MKYILLDEVVPQTLQLKTENWVNRGHQPCENMQVAFQEDETASGKAHIQEQGWSMCGEQGRELWDEERVVGGAKIL